MRKQSSLSLSDYRPYRPAPAVFAKRLPTFKARSPFPGWLWVLVAILAGLVSFALVAALITYGAHLGRLWPGSCVLHVTHGGALHCLAVLK